MRIAVSEVLWLMRFLCRLLALTVFIIQVGESRMDKENVKQQWSKRGHWGVRDPPERMCSRETEHSYFTTSSMHMVS